ncbi:hypothetical protein [Rhodopseudomonas palustris]|uniref:hypothetical protein n=1 Tax=Rhodopseudomonas palustris TaxID=1076 RepID=UPI001FD8A382|nr:hypothetical protein [Rhodopseudomonas palustris]
MFSAAVLGGCAVDAHINYVPDFMKQPVPSQPVNLPPDVGEILKGNVAAVFAQGASPTAISYSSPVPGKFGGWDTCVQGDVVGVTGKPLGVQLFLVNIDRDRIGRRERVGDDHWCATQVFKSL